MKILKSLREYSAVLLKDESLNTLHGRKKAAHILTYYKFPLIILCVFLYFIGYNIYGNITHKDAILYVAPVNVVAGEDLTAALGDGFTLYQGAELSGHETVLYNGLYLTDDELNEWHEYTYASRMKILAAVEGKQMDVVLMNREAFDAFSQKGWLYDLDLFLSKNEPELHEKLNSKLVSNIIILEDNVADLILDDSVSYTAVTEEHPFGLDLSETDLIRQAGFEDTVYLGVIANSPRTDTVISYLRYLTAEKSD